MTGGVHDMGGGNAWWGAGMAGGGGAWQEKWQLEWMVRILLESILLSQSDFLIAGLGSLWQLIC